MLELNTAKDSQRITEVLFNEENTEPIQVVDANGRTLKLEQVFATMVDGKAYCILAPINKVEGLDEGVGLVFRVEDNSLVLENEHMKISEIFHEYYDALRAARDQADGGDVA